MTQFAVPLPADYRAADFLAYHGRDPLSLSERVAGTRFEKPLRLSGGLALLSLDISDTVALANFDRALGAAESVEAHDIVARLLGFFSDPAGFEAMAAAATIAAARPGLRIPLTATVFEAVCWAVIGQQINLTFAAALRREMIALAGTQHPGSGLLAHPGPDAVASLDPADLAARRFSRSKARYLVETSAAIAAGTPSLESLAAAGPETAEAALTALRGIGPWTARYILLRGFGFPDVAPVGDSGLATGLERLHGLDRRPDISEQEAAMRAFAPHRSLATVHLWASLKDQPGAKSRKPTTLANRPDAVVAKSVPPATAGPEAGPSVQLKRSRSP